MVTKIILELASFLNRVSEQLFEHSDFHYSPNKLRYVLGGALTQSPHKALCSPLRNETSKKHFQILLASSKNENGTIDYNKFDSLVNYQSSPARAATAEDHAPRMSQPKGSFFSNFRQTSNLSCLNFAENWPKFLMKNAKRHSIIRRCRL